MIERLPGNAGFLAMVKSFYRIYMYWYQYLHVALKKTSGMMVDSCHGYFNYSEDLQIPW